MKKVATESISTKENMSVYNEPQKIITESARPTGRVTAWVDHPDGTRRPLGDRKLNRFTNVGIKYIHDSVYGLDARASGAAKWVSVSADTTVPTDADTNLAGEILASANNGLSRAKAQYSYNADMRKTTITHTYTASAVVADINKSGLHTSDVGGTGETITNAAVFNAKETLQNGSKLTVIWEIDIG